tara:strand:- start:451 stop:699 length:249 start_codon:yes stop_codon:yes gene_type:complete
VEDERLTHEWLNAYDALLAGDAKPTLKLVAADKPVPELVRSHLARLFDGDEKILTAVRSRFRSKSLDAEEVVANSPFRKVLN